MTIQLRLILLFFLQFAVWGSYLTSMGNYLAQVGLGSNIGWFYTVQGIVSLFMPTLMGIVADRKIEAQRLLGMLHMAAGALMLVVWWIGQSQGANVTFNAIFWPYAVSVAFYMPTLGLSNSVAYTAMQREHIDVVGQFPRIRIFGTVGFLVTMWMVDLLKYQQTATQFLVCGICGLLMGCYALTMPHCPVNKDKGEGQTWVQRMGLDAFSLLRTPRMLIFFLFSMMLGVSLQITNGYAAPYISSFGNVEAFAGSYFAEHANLLISLSQVSETLCILLIPFFMRRYGIRTVMLIAMTAWMLRFGLLGLGAPVWPGITCLVLSMIVYGVAFDFFNISGSMFVDSEVPVERRSSAQGLFMLMTNGLGAAIGTLGAQAIVNHFVYDVQGAEAQLDGWRTSWFIFAAYSALVLVAFAVLFRNKKAVK